MSAISPVKSCQQSHWCKVVHPNPAASIRLVCFPPVGAGASFYAGWGDRWAHVEVCAIQPPGHEQRICEEPLTRMSDAVDQVLEEIPIDKPFAFFGHSLGALVAYELTCRMAQEKMSLPLHLLLSACPAPQANRLRRRRHLLPDSELIRYLGMLGGTPEDVLRHKSLMEVVLPIIRADFEIADGYVFQGWEPLPIPITAFGGTEDIEVTVDEVAAWRSQTNTSFRLRIFPGNHFYLHTQFAELEQEMLYDLRRCI